MMPTSNPENTPALEDDPFDTLLNLEERIYNEGYKLGVSDGKRAGLLEGRAFGLETGFEKYAAMGNLHGRATVWAGRLPTGDDDQQEEDETHISEINNIHGTTYEQDRSRHCLPQQSSHAPSLSNNARLKTHLRTLYALVEPSSLSTENTEDAVSEFEDRLKRAEGKVKIIEKLTGETSASRMSNASTSNPRQVSKSAGDGGIEDISILGARH